MPKRANPYSEDFQPQVKTRVGIMHIYKGTDRMKSVYEKTINILFQGANQKNNNCFNLPKVETPAREAAPAKEEKMKTFKQMFFGNDLRLQQDGEIKTEAEVTCGLCSSVGDTAAHCSYCETPRCATCRTLCAHCSRPTCSRCSISSYDSQHGGVFCLSCC